jgi:glycosyltransferase involved in cell wall biosynthesis
MSLTFSIIVPSYNQPDYIEFTCQNLAELKQKSSQHSIKIEVLLFDSCSNSATQEIIQKYKSIFDVLVVEKDKGQYDAINQGIEKCTGEYWTWLNTDDLLDIDGFFKLVDVLKGNISIDYIYGGVSYINEKGDFLKTINTWELNLEQLVTKEPSVFQPGSFFKKSFTDKIGLLKSYRCCFDYEYILRCMKNNATIYQCDFAVSKFRYYKTSKTGSITPIFIREQLLISKDYGRKWYHYLTSFSKLRLLKHLLFPRK